MADWRIVFGNLCLENCGSINCVFGNCVDGELCLEICMFGDLCIRRIVLMGNCVLL